MANESASAQAVELCLVQTVGTSTIPALVAAVALRPRRVVHLHMPDEREPAARAARAIVDAVDGCAVELVAVGFDDPLVESREAAARAIDGFRARGGGRVIVHVTGSTKLLAIGAYEAARAASAECFYLELPRDDEDGVPQVVSLGTGALDSDAVAALGRDPSGLLSFEMIALARGFDVHSPGLDYRGFVALARTALGDSDAEEAMHAALPAIGGDRAPWPAEARWQEWTRTFTGPRELSALAVEAGILQEAGGGRVRLAEPGEGFDDRHRREILERHASLLRGAWLEVALADAMSRTSGLHDVRWSVEAESPRPMEHDVICLKGTTLVVASAKRSLQAGIFGHLRELKAHAMQLGGTKSIPVLCVARLDRRRMGRERASVADDLLEVAHGMGIRVVGRRQLIDGRIDLRM
jgi:hypothetical protein